MIQNVEYYYNVICIEGIRDNEIGHSDILTEHRIHVWHISHSRVLSLS